MTAAKKSQRTKAPSKPQPSKQAKAPKQAKAQIKAKAASRAKTNQTKAPKRAKTKPARRGVFKAADELTPSSGELASTLGNLGAGVIQSHLHSPGGHGPDPDGSEVVDAAGDLHSDDRDVDDNESAVDEVVESRATVDDIENVGRLQDDEEENETDEDEIEESKRSFLDAREPERIRRE